MIQMVLRELLYRINTGILDKKFQEITSLSTVFCLFIHKISSKHDRETTVSKFISVLLT